MDHGIVVGPTADPRQPLLKQLEFGISELIGKCLE
jgi:hypothetical protein